MREHALGTRPHRPRRRRQPRRPARLGPRPGRRSSRAASSASRSGARATKTATSAGWRPEDLRGDAPNPAPGVPVSSYRHPFQTFQWADYSAAPGRDLHLPRSSPVSGTPAALVHGAGGRGRRSRPSASTSAAMPSSSTAARSARRSTRGASRTEAAREVGQAAYDWLSRGLVEGLESFIGQAGAGDALLGAFFEFKNTRIYARAPRGARRAARRSRSSTTATASATPTRRRWTGQASTAWSSRATRSGGFAHNKFLVLSRGGQPSEVWTGSTNLSRERRLRPLEQRAHRARRGVADEYSRYWHILDEDPTHKPTALADERALAAACAGRRRRGRGRLLAARSLDALDGYARDRRRRDGRCS